MIMFPLFSNKLGKLSQEISDMKGIDTIFFIHKSEIPADRLKKLHLWTHSCCIQTSQTSKTMDPSDSWWKDQSAPTIDVTTIKVLWNSTLSTLDAKYMTLNISNFYLGTPMERPE